MINVAEISLATATLTAVHGHTYFIKDLEIDIESPMLDQAGLSIDFGIIKQYFKVQWDHKLIFPEHVDEKLITELLKIFSYLGIKDNLVIREGTTAEVMAMEIRSDLTKLVKTHYHHTVDEVDISFTICEGPNQGVRI